MSDWIACSERLPDVDVRVLVAETHNIYTAVRIYYTNRALGYYWHVIGGNRLLPKEVTHWMPLPEPPHGK